MCVIVLFDIEFNTCYVTGMSEVWFIVDIMELRGYEREVGSFLLSVTGIGNFLGRGIGAFIRLYARYLPLSLSISLSISLIHAEPNRRTSIRNIPLSSYLEDCYNTN